MMKRICTIMLLFVIVTACNNYEKKAPAKRGEITNVNHIGELFYLDRIVDSSGKEVKIDFSKSRFNLIDFWNNQCPPCLEEMNQFPKYISGKEKLVSVYSISLSQFQFWKPVMDSHRGPFEILAANIENWKQYNLITSDNPRFRNELSADRLEEIDSMYLITGFPSYFVVDSSGTLISRPASGVDFLKKIQ